MKKILVAAAIVLVGSAIFTSCTKKYVTEGSNSNDNSAYSMTYTLTQSSWQYDNSNACYYVSLQDQNLTSDITDNGAVWIYISLDGGNNYELLPSMSNQGYNFIGIAGDGGFTIDAFPVDATVTAAPNFQIIVKEVNIPGLNQNQAASVNFKDLKSVEKTYVIKNMN